MIKGWNKRVVDWNWTLCNITFESRTVPEDWRSAVIVPLHKGKGKGVPEFNGIELKKKNTLIISNFIHVLVIF